MTDERIQIPDINGERVQILSMEYKALRSDLQMRSSARFQFLGLVTAAAAVLATGLGSSHAGRTTLILEILACVLFVLGLVAFWRQGRDQARISFYISRLEDRINSLVPPESGKAGLLRWEAMNQKRSNINKWILGLDLTEKARADIEKYLVPDGDTAPGTARAGKN
jgi:hypothetical protein